MLGTSDRVRRRPGGGAPAQPPSRALRFASHLAFVQLLYHADLSSLRAGLRSRAALATPLVSSKAWCVQPFVMRDIDQGSWYRESKCCFANSLCCSTAAAVHACRCRSSPCSIGSQHWNRGG